MYASLCLILLFVVTGFSNIENNLIVDYFVYQNTRSVIGFSCNGIKDDSLLIKELNNMGINSIISKANYKSRINNFAYTIYRTLGVFFDLRCYDANTIISIFLNAGDHNMYNSLHYWLVIGSTITNISELIDDRNFGYSTNFVIAVPLISTKDYKLYDVYNLWKERGLKLNIDLIGFWSKEDGINFASASRFERRANLRGVIMRASFYQIFHNFSKDELLENYLQDYSKITTESISKFGFAMLTHLSDLLNFKLQCKLVPTWKKGDLVGPTIGAILKKECDITGTPAIITQPRITASKFTFELLPYRTFFIFRSPQPKVISAEQIFGPLDTNVWLITLAIFILSTCLFVIVLRYDKLNKSNFWRYSDSILATIGAISQQGTELRLNLVSTRFVYFFITLFSFLLYNYYSAIIVSIRLNEPIFKLNDSLAVLARTDLTLLSDWMDFLEFFMKKKEWEIQFFYNTRWKDVPNEKKYMKPDQALVLVKQGGYAYHANPNVAYSYINKEFTEREICELTEIYLIRPCYANFAVDKNSTIVEMLRVGITKMSEVGLRNRQVIRWEARRPICKKDAIRASSITFYQFAPHLLVVISGIGLAITVLAFEIIGAKWKNLNFFNFLK